MEDLLKALKTEIAANLSYLGAVEILDGEEFVPGEAIFPLIGLLDGGTVHQSMPGKKDLDVLSVKIVPYQAVFLDTPGASIIGSETQLGAAGKGVLKIAQDLQTLLNDNFLSVAKIHYAHLDREDASENLARESDFITMKRLHFTYRRYL